MKNIRAYKHVYGNGGKNKKKTEGIRGKEIVQKSKTSMRLRAARVVGNIKIPFFCLLFLKFTVLLYNRCQQTWEREIHQTHIHHQGSMNSQILKSSEFHHLTINAPFTPYNNDNLLLESETDCVHF